MEWEKIYSQTGPSSFARDGCKLDDCNVQVDSDNFINFDVLQNQDQYRFKMVWSTAGLSMPSFMPADTWDADTLIWTQKENPLSATDTDMHPTDISLTPGNLPIVPFFGQRFTGLSLSVSNPVGQTLLDGQVNGM